MSNLQDDDSQHLPHYKRGYQRIKPILGGDGHDQVPHGKPLLGADGHGLPPPVLGGDNHDKVPHGKPLLGGDGHDRVPHGKPLLGANGHGLPPHSQMVGAGKPHGPKFDEDTAPSAAVDDAEAFMLRKLPSMEVGLHSFRISRF